MPTDRNPSLLSFLARSLWPFAAFFLFLSIGLNAFFLTVDRFRQVPKPATTITAPATTGVTLQELQRGPKAFGVINRGFSVQPQTAAKTVSFPSVHAYEIPANTLPELPATFMLYRDQGVDIDTELLQSVFRKLGAPLTLEDKKFFTTSMTFRSLDGSLETAIDAEHRTLSITNTRPLAALPDAVRADDAECIALAREFMTSMGLGFALSGEPRVEDRADATGVAKTFVVWDAVIDTYPLMDLSMKPVARAEVQVGRMSKEGIFAKIRLVDPGLLARSAYPTAPSDAMRLRLLSGGFLPLSSEKKAKGISVSYSRLTPVYLLYPSDHENPTYLVPALRAQWSMDQSCKNCSPLTFATFVPALDPEAFRWTLE